MKRKILLIAFLGFTITIMAAKATTFTNYLPGGKNYLDENNLATTSNSISTKSSFRVKENSYYTLSMPGYDMISNLSITIEGNVTYFDSLVSAEELCISELQKTICTFHTNIGDEYINVYITSSDIVYYLNSYGFFGFQLEEGIVATDYEKYIIPLIDTTNPEFLGTGAYIKSYNQFESIEDIISKHIVVIDEIDGDISNRIEIVTNEYTGMEQIVGDYLVELSAHDLSGNAAYFSLIILVKDEIKPIITGLTNINLSVSIDKSILEIINENFTIFDDHINSTINILEDEYTINKDIIGTYYVLFEVHDDYGNNATKFFYIKLVDIEAPIIEGNLVVNSLLSNPVNLNDFMDSLIITDNYDDSQLLIPVILINQFIGNELIPGIYIVNFEVSDISGNVVERDIIITVIDDVFPVISGPNNYSGSYTELLSLSDFLEMLIVGDNIGTLGKGDVYIISDNYSGRTESIGNFEIIFGIKDSNGNETRHVLNVSIIDDISPLIYIDQSIITVNLSSTFSENDALKLLIDSSELFAGNYTIRTLINEYSGNEKKLGTYIYKLEFTNEEGLVFEKEFIVKVVDDTTNKFDEELLTRNIIIYSCVVIFIGYAVIKYKK